MTKDELDAMAHSIAYEASVSLIENCCVRTIVRVETAEQPEEIEIDLCSAGDAQRAVDEAVVYLAARGLLIFAPQSCSRLSGFRDESEALV